MLRGAVVVAPNRWQQQQQKFKYVSRKHPGVTVMILKT
jgi:hypothetical protein